MENLVKRYNATRQLRKSSRYAGRGPVYKVLCEREAQLLSEIFFS